MALIFSVKLIRSMASELDANRRELRALERELKQDETNEVVIAQLATVKETIKRLEERRECYLNRETTICE